MTAGEVATLQQRPPSQGNNEQPLGHLNYSTNYNTGGAYQLDNMSRGASVEGGTSNDGKGNRIPKRLKITANTIQKIKLMKSSLKDKEENNEGDAGTAPINVTRFRATNVSYANFEGGACISPKKKIILKQSQITRSPVKVGKMNIN